MGRAVLIAMIPVNLLAVPWVWAGRLLFGVGGWFLLILAPVAILLAFALLVTTVLALTQAGRPRALTPAQAVAQLVTWAGLLGFGALLPDFGDAPDSTLSLLTQLFGYSDRLIALSETLAGLSGVVAVAGWLGLLVLLIGARREA